MIPHNPYVSHTYTKRMKVKLLVLSRLSLCQRWTPWKPVNETCFRTTHVVYHAISLTCKSRWPRRKDRGFHSLDISSRAYGTTLFQYHRIYWDWLPVWRSKERQAQVQLCSNATTSQQWSHPTTRPAEEMKDMNVPLVDPFSCPNA